MTFIVITEESLEMLHSPIRTPIVERGLNFNWDLAYLLPEIVLNHLVLRPGDFRRRQGNIDDSRKGKDRS